MKINLGIIAGSGLLPLEIANLAKQNGQEVFIAALDSEANVALLNQHKYKIFSIGSVGSILEYFTENNVGEIIIIGGIIRPDLRSIKLDVTGSLLLAKILKEKFLGDDNVLKIVANFIELKGFKVISAKTLLKLGTYEKFCITKNLPSDQDIIDIEIGHKVLKALGTMDVGQAVIVADGYVLGIECAEGTDNLIRRSRLLRKKENGGVLVKMAKSAQDMRFDLPTIGPDTAFYLAKHGYNGIAIGSLDVIIVNPIETIALLNQNNLFISYL